ncbi:MAG TPA: BadF/BadG/BcrA/BcrD ATPase family protein [Bryobacteraceae bacterium]|nr:BadF/BadG/BcrA/BcrD ATPase family protein [Bryobacteraceae bacterium]
MTNRKLYLGIDGGQSSTTALIGDEEGSVLGSGRGGPCNHVSAAEGRAKFLNAIGGCVSQACAEAGLDPASVTFEAVCGGFSGGPEDKEALLRELVPSKALKVTNDAVIALSGAHAGKPGVITIAGTGSISYARAADGRLSRAGGWGYIYGDEGGGFDLTRQALRAALRYEEGWGPPTALHGVLLQRTGARNANDLLHQFYASAFSRPEIAAMSQLVDDAARNGDPVAYGIVTNAAQQLAMITSAVRHQAFAPSESTAIAYIGGVFKSELLLERFRSVVELEDGNVVSPPLYGPATGALLEAYALAGLQPTLRNVPEFEK